MPNDGEYGKSMSTDIDLGAWWSYSSSRRRAGARTMFAEAYQDPKSGIALGESAPGFPTCTGPLTYTGRAKIATDIANREAALDANGYQEGFLTSLSPGSCSRIGDTYHATEEEVIILQIDDPSVAGNWDQINPPPPSRTTSPSPASGTRR